MAVVAAAACPTAETTTAPPTPPPDEEEGIDPDPSGPKGPTVAATCRLSSSKASTAALSSAESGFVIGAI